ncbi:MaoC family dehydratase N-terminal domain-containing protein [Alphaproteobacteria bacterium]|nr:MaoC family dehydratase N-terminal domain-containing protein [Alphaproteobacteria bacterium]
MNYDDWIGHSFTRTDIITPRLVTHFTDTFTPHIYDAAEVPLGLFWCLCPDAVPTSDIGGDGHPKLGIFLPDIGYERRMWAGGSLTFSGQFKIGDTVTKTTTIRDIQFKHGKSGNLCFVTIGHDYHVADALIVAERQDVVYRETNDISAVASPAMDTTSPGLLTWQVTPSSLMMFRYSALTFNGHRIHYDHPYATTVEGYDGLLVHGPMQATLLLNIAAAHKGRPPSTFSYRGVAPLVLGGSINVTLSKDGSDQLNGCVTAQDGTVTTRAKIT